MMGNNAIDTTMKLGSQCLAIMALSSLPNFTEGQTTINVTTTEDWNGTTAFTNTTDFDSQTSMMTVSEVVGICIGTNLFGIILVIWAFYYQSNEPDKKDFAARHDKIYGQHGRMPRVISDPKLVTTNQNVSAMPTFNQPMISIHGKDGLANPLFSAADTPTRGEAGKGHNDNGDSNDDNDANNGSAEIRKSSIGSMKGFGDDDVDDSGLPRTRTFGSTSSEIVDAPRDRVDTFESDFSDGAGLRDRTSTVGSDFRDETNIEDPPVKQNLNNSFAGYGFDDESDMATTTIPLATEENNDGSKHQRKGSLFDRLRGGSTNSSTTSKKSSINKLSIGSPSDFQHIGHIGMDSTTTVPDAQFGI